jgi:hypothetical protein
LSEARVFGGELIPRAAFAETGDVLPLSCLVVRSQLETLRHAAAAVLLCVERFVLPNVTKGDVEEEGIALAGRVILSLP